MIGTLASELAQERSIEGISFDDLLALEQFPDDGGATVYLSGSLVAGLGNPWSDIDLFAITDREATGPFVRHASTNDTSAHFVNGRRVDYEFWRPAQVRRLAERLSEVRIGSGKEIQGTTFLLIEECFIHRLRIGVPLLNREQFIAYQALFDFDLFRAYQTEDVIRYTDALHEDVCGMLEGGDTDVALLRARDLVEGAVDAYCHRLGNTDPTRKWRIMFLEALGDGSPRHQRIIETFWHLQFPDIAALRADGEACRAHIEECIRFAASCERDL